MHRDASEDSTTTATSIQFSVDSSFVGGDGGDGAGRSRRSSAGNKNSANRKTVLAKGAPWASAYSFHTVSPPATQGVKSKLASGSTAPTAAAAPPKSSSQHPPLFPQQPSPPAAPRGALVTSPASASSSVSFVEAPVVLHPSRSVSPSDASLLFVQAVAKLDSPLEASLTKPKQQQRQQEHDMSSDQESESRNADRDSYHPRLMPQGSTSKSGGGNMKSVSANLASHSITSSRDSIDFQVDDNDGDDAPPPPPIAPPAVSATAAREGDGERGGTSLPSKPLAQQPALSAVKTATPPATLTVGGKTLVLKTATAHGGAGAKVSAAANAPPPCVVSPEQLTPMKTVTAASGGGAAGPALMAPSSPPSRSPPPGHGGASSSMGSNDGQQQQQLLQRPVVTPIHATSQPSGAAVSTTSTQNRAGSLTSPRHDVLSAHGPRGPGRSVLAAAAGEGTTALEPHLPSPLQPSRPHGEEDDDDARMHTLHQRTQSLSSPASTHISNIASGVHFNRAASFSHTSLPEPNHSNSGGGSQQRRASSVSVQPEDDPVYCTVSEMTNAASMRGGTLSMHPIGMATAASGGANNNSVASPRRPTLAPSATSAARHVQSFDMSLDESNAQLTMGTPRELSGRHGTGGSWRVKGSSAASQPNLAGDAAATASNSTPSPTTLSPSPTYSNVRHVMPLPTFSRPDTAGKGDGDGKQLTASTKSAPSAVAATAAPRTSSRGHAASLASGAGVNPNSRSGRTSQSGEGSGRPSAACGVEDQESQKQQQQQQQQPRRRSGVSAVLNALGGKLLQRRRESGSTASKSGTDDDDGNNDADGSATSLRSRHSTSRSFISGLSRVSSRLKRGARKAIAAGRTSGKAASSKQTSDLRNNSGVQQAAAAAATTEQGTDAATEVQTVADTATNTTVTMAPADQPTRFDSAARGRGGRGPGGGDGDGGGGGGAVVSLMAPHALSPAQLQLVRPTPTRDNQSLSVDGSIDFYTDVEETREAEMLASHEGPRGPPRPIANASDTAPHSGTVPSQPRLPMQEAEEYRDNGSSSARGGEEREHEAGEEEEVEDGTAAQPRNDGATQRKKRKEEKSQSRHRHRSHRKHHHHRSRTSTMSDNNNSNREDAVLADESSSSTSSSSPASSASITSSVLRRHKERERRRRRQHRSEKRRRKETANQKSTADAERSADKRLNESQQARQREMESRSAATRPRQRRVMSANASAVATSDEEQRRRSSSWHRTRHGARARHNAKKDKAGVMLMGKQLYHSKLGEEAVHLYAAAEEYVRRRLRRSCERQDERSGVANGADAHERGRTAASAAQAGSNHRLRRQRQGKQGREAGDAGNAPEQSLAEALAARRRAILAESRVHSSVNHFRAAWHNHTMDRQRRWLQQYDAYKDWRRRLQQREKERKLRSQEAAIAAAVATAASRSASRSRAMLDEVSCSKNANSRNPKSPSARPAAREASLKNGVSLTGRAASVRRQQRLDAYEAALTSEIALLDEAIEKMRRHALWAEASPAAAAIVAESNTHKEPQDAGAPAMSADEHVATPLPHRQPTSACSKPQGGAPKAEKPVTLRRSDQSRNDANAEQRGSKQQRKTQYSSLTEAADAVRCAPPSAVVACRTPARATVELQRRYEELLDEMVAHMEGGEARVGNNRSNSTTSLAGRRRSSAQGSQKSPVHVPSKRFTPWRSADEEGKAGARQCAEALRAEYYRLSRFSSTPPADMQRQRPPQPLPTASEEDNTSSPMKREEEEEEVLARIETSYAQALRPSCAVCRPQRFDEYVTLGLLSMLHSTSEPSTDVVRNAADATGTGTGARPAKHPSSPRTLLQRRIREDLYAPPKRSSKPHVAGAAAVTGGVMVEAPQLAPPPQPPPPPEPHPFTPSLSLVLDSLRARLMKDEHRARATLIAAEEAAAEALRRQYIIATICILRALRAKEEAEEAAKEKARETLQLQLQQQQQQQLLLQQALSSHSYGSSRRLFEEEQEEEEDQQHVTHEPVAPAIATASEPSFSNALLVGRSDNLRGDDSSNSSSHRRSDNEEEEEDDDDDLRGRCHADRLGDRDAQSRCSGSSGSCGSRPHTCSWRGTTPPPLHAERLDEGNRREHLPSVESDDHHHHNNNGSAGVVRRALQRDVALLQNVSASRVTEPSHSPLSSTRAGADYTRMSSGSSGNVRGHGPFSSTQPGSPASEEPMHELETRNAASAAGENSTPSTAFSQSSRGEAAQSSTSDDDHDGENQRRHSEDASTPLFELHDDKDREESDSKKDSSQASSTTHVTPSAESLPLPAAPPAALHVEKGTAVAETAKEAKEASCSQREDGKELSNAVRRTPEGPAHAGNAERHGDDDASSASLEFQTNEDEASKADSAAASDESPTSNSGSNNKSRRSSILLTQTDTSMTPVVAAPSTSNQETSHISEPLTSVEKATTTDDKVSSKGSKDACVRPLSIDRNDHLASSCPSSDASLEDASDAQSDSQDTTKKDTAAPDLVKAERRETQKPTETAPAGAREQEKQPEAEAAQPPTADKANTENGKIAEKEEKDDDDDNDDDEEFVVHVGAATAQEKAREEEKAEIGVTPQQHDKGGVSGGEGAKSEPVVLAEVTPSDNEADMNAEGAADAAAHPAAGDAVVEGDSEVAPDKEAAPPSIEREDDEADGAEERKATTAAAAASAVAIVNAGDAGREVDASPPPHDTIIAESRADTPANSATDRALLDAASQTPPLLLSCLVQRQPSSPRRRVRFSLPPEHAQESGGSSDEEAGGAAVAGRDDEDKRSEHADVCERAEISSSTDAATPEKPHDSPRAATHERDDDAPHNEEGDEAEEEGEDGVSERTATDLLEKLNELDALLLYEFPSYFTTGTDRDGFPAAVMRPLRDTYTPRRASLLPAAAAAAAAAAPTATPLPGVVRRTSFFTPAPPAVLPSLSPSVVGVSPTKPSETLLEVEEPQDAVHKGDTVPPRVEAGDAAREKKVSDVPAYQPTPLAPPQLPAESLASQLRRKYGLRPPPSLSLSRPTTAAPAFPAADRLSRRSSREVPTLPSSLSSTRAATTASAAVAASSPVAVPASGAADLRATTRTPPAAGSKSTAVASRTPAQPAAKPRPTTTDTSIEAVQEPATAQASQSKREKASADFSRRAAEEAPLLSAHQSRLPTPNDLTAAQKTALLLSDRSLSLASSATTQTSDAAATAAPLEQARLDGEELQQLSQQPSHTMQFSKLSAPVKVTAATVRHTVPSSLVGQGGEASSFTATSSFDSSPLSVSAAEEAQEAVPRSGIEVPPLARPKRASHWF